MCGRNRQGHPGGRGGVAVKVTPHEKFPGVYWAKLEDGSRKLATLNLAPGRMVYGEELVSYKRKEYRIWNPFRSKLAAAILNHLQTVPISPRHKVLYLGAATGTTPSHVSDIVGHEGYVYCVEFAARVMRELISNVCAYRPNMSPILADARFAENYRVLVETVDDIYCDIAQPEQARILADNADMYLTPGGYVMLAIKSQSIDVTKTPSEIYRREIEVLKKRGFKIAEVINLEPYEKAHVMVVAEFKR
jgi:fibrillarin-like pre-rRNA processing protein